MTDPGLTDLLAAEAAAELRKLAMEHQHTAARLIALARKISPPCGDWADGHSSRRCDRPKGHEGHHG